MSGHQTDYVQFWCHFIDTTNRLKRKSLFKGPSFLEAKESFLQLQLEAKRLPVEYQAVCALALAKCEDSLAKHEENNETKHSTISIEECERGRRRCEFARFYFRSRQHSLASLQAAYSGHIPSITLIPLASAAQIVISPMAPIPIEKFRPLAQTASAIQSYLIAIHLYDANMKINMAAALRYELGLQYEKIGDNGTAGLFYQIAAKELLLQQVRVPVLNRNLQSSSDGTGQTIVKEVARRATSRAPMTAFCALSRALENNIHCSNYIKGSKLALELLEVLDHDREFIPGFNEKILEVLITLFLLFTFQREFSKAHKILQRITHDHMNISSSGVLDDNLWEIGLTENSFHVDLYDFVTAYFERDLDCMEDVGMQLYPHFTLLQQELLLIILEQSKLNLFVEDDK